MYLMVFFFFFIIYILTLAIKRLDDITKNCKNVYVINLAKVFHLPGGGKETIFGGFSFPCNMIRVKKFPGTFLKEAVYFSAHFLFR